MHKRKSVTLVELIIAVSLFIAIIAGVMSFDVASREFFASSERKTDVLNDLTFVLEHLHKNVTIGIGDDTGGRRAINVSQNDPVAGAITITINQDTPLTPANYGDDTAVTYVFDPAPGINQVTFQGEILSRKLTAVTIQETDGGLEILNITMLDDPSTAMDERTNPQVIVTDQFFFPLSQSLSPQ